MQCTWVMRMELIFSNMAKIFCKYCSNILQTLLKYFANIAHISKYDSGHGGNDLVIHFWEGLFCHLIFGVICSYSDANMSLEHLVIVKVEDQCSGEDFGLQWPPCVRAASWETLNFKWKVKEVKEAFIYRVLFNTGPPPKISKYRQVNLC